MRGNAVRRFGVAAVAAAVAVALAACSSSGIGAAPGSTTQSVGGSAGWATAQSAQAGGGTGALVAAARKEGALNLIAVPRTWAGYGAIVDAFTTKYHLAVNSENPDGSSGDEINAVKSTRGQSSAPDVLDIGNSYALSGAQDGLFAPYRVTTWSAIPDEQKDPGGLWFSGYGGYIAIGCNAAKVGGRCPNTIKELDSQRFKGKVALNGDPTSANAAFEAVWAAALANGGSAVNIQPGVDFFKKLNSAGIFNKTKVTPATVQSGATPIVLDWDYLNVGNAAALKKAGITWTTTVPADGMVSSYYAQAININAPHPAAARLWEEFLYSQQVDGGQNGWLRGSARPVELPAMQRANTVDRVALAAVPPVTDPSPFGPTQAQITAAKAVVTQQWAAAVS